MKGLRKLMGDNHFDGLITSINNLAGYADTHLQFPDLGLVKPHQGVDPELIAPLVSGTSASELEAILFYTKEESLVPEISQIMMGIALVEMQHYDKLQDLLNRLYPEDAKQRLASSQTSNLQVVPTEDMKEALEKALDLEEMALTKYSMIYEQINGNRLPTPTCMVVIKFFTKLIADERRHRDLIMGLLQPNKTNTTIIVS